MNAFEKALANVIREAVTKMSDEAVIDMVRDRLNAGILSLQPAPQPPKRASRGAPSERNGKARLGRALRALDRRPLPPPAPAPPPPVYRPAGVAFKPAPIPKRIPLPSSASASPSDSVRPPAARPPVAVAATPREPATGPVLTTSAEIRAAKALREGELRPGVVKRRKKAETDPALNGAAHPDASPPSV